MRKVNGVLIFMFRMLPLTALGASPDGVLSGVVVDDRGAPIANATVLYRTVQAITTGASGRPLFTGPFASGAVKTAVDGSFAAGGLPASTYHLCAYGTKASHLGSCEWGQGTTRVDLAAGQTAQLRFVVAEGTLVTFRVEDPRRQVRDLESLQTPGGRLPLSGANFAVGIWAGTRYARAGLVSTNGATRLYQVAIPKTATVRLFLDTSLGVVDGSGLALPVARPGVTVPAAGQAEATVNLTIP